MNLKKLIGPGVVGLILGFAGAHGAGILHTEQFRQEILGELKELVDKHLNRKFTTADERIAAENRIGELIFTSNKALGMVRGKVPAEAATASKRLPGEHWK